MISNVYLANELEDYTGELSFTVNGWDKEPRISFVKQHLHSLHGTTSLQIPVIAHIGALQKDVYAFGMGLAIAHNPIAANPAVTRKTASLKNVSLCS